jgi:hypothetical protein
MNKSLRYLALAFALPLVACGDDDDGTDPNLNVVLNSTVIFSGATTSCATGGVSRDFTSQSGKTVAVTVSGPSALTPQFVLYAPDFETQIAASASTGAGRAALNHTLTETGVHHLTFCDANGASGSINVVVTAQ